MAQQEMPQAANVTQLLLAKEKEFHCPDFWELDILRKSKLVERLRHHWPVQPQPRRTKLKPPEVLKIVRELCAGYQHLRDSTGANFLSKFAVECFEQTTDLLGPNPHGIPNVSETILLMADFVFRLNKPILAKYGFPEDLAGLAHLDQIIADSLGEGAVRDAAAQYYHELTFGNKWDLEALEPVQADSVRNTNHLIWMGLLASKTPVVASYMSYIHHLALPPLERRYRSFARTMAYVDALLAPKLQLYRSRRVSQKLEVRQDKKDRVIWVLNATESHLVELARRSYFDDAAAFRGEHESLTIYLMGDFEGAEASTCGGSVKVHLVDQKNVVDIPKPELAFMFNVNAESGDPDHLHQILQIATMQHREWLPVLVLTCRCEAEARRLRDALDTMGLMCAWPFLETPGHLRRDSLFVRNLYSAMASDPDIEYDDNGWVGAVFRSNLDMTKLLWWHGSAECFHQDLQRLLELNKQRAKWKEEFLVHARNLKGLLPMCGDPSEGDEFTAEHLVYCQEFFGGRYECNVATLIDLGHLEVMSPEEAAARDAAKRSEAEREAEAAEAAAQQPKEVQKEGQEEEEAEYRVVYSRVIMRSEPSTKSATVGVHQQGSVVRGVAVVVDGDRWLRISHAKAVPASQAKNGSAKPAAQEAWMLIDGQKLGLGTLLERTAPPARAPQGKEPEAADDRGAPAKPQSDRSPAVFWGILDLKYEPGKDIEGQVKVLETGDGRLSRFSGYGATIKESFQQENKLEETIRRAVLTENKKLTHDVIVDHGYGHLRPRQQEFRKEYTPELAGSIRAAFSLQDGDICVLKLCNRARGAGVIPVYVTELDEKLQQLLQPPADVEAWFREQPQDWATSVTWGCFEEQVRHWWSNECPCFLVEEFCMSTPTEKEGRQFDGTMRVGFSLHRERRNKLPPGWVDSPEGPVRVHRDGEDASASSKPLPWNDDRRYLDLFRQDTSILRVQWLGGYWKLPIEDVTSQDLRGKIVSVAKQGTAPVSDSALHSIYAALGHMVSLLFGSNDISQQALRTRYKSFPELASFMIARLACSVRSADKAKSLQLMELAQMYMEKEAGVCKDCVTSYIQRNLGVAEAARKAPQWLNAATHWRKSMSAMPTNANALHLLGLHHLETGDPQRAADLLESVLLLDPDFKAPYACLGVARLRMGQYERAVAISSAGLARHPYTPACRYNMGVAYFALAVMKEQDVGKGHIASELRARASEELEIARDQRFAYQPWELQDDAMVAQLRDEGKPLAWNGKRLPRDGWRLMGWRP